MSTAIARRLARLEQALSARARLAQSLDPAADEARALALAQYLEARLRGENPPRPPAAPADAEDHARAQGLIQRLEAKLSTYSAPLTDRGEPHGL